MLLPQRSDNPRYRSVLSKTRFPNRILIRWNGNLYSAQSRNSLKNLSLKSRLRVFWRVRIRQFAYACSIFFVTSSGVPVLAEEVRKYPVFSSDLIKGRSVWLANCETCHAYGTAGAPNPFIPTQWEMRLQKPLPLLYEHAIEGFYGETDTYMPARGGNPDLSDKQIQSAVDYMLALAQFISDTKVK